MSRAFAAVAALLGLFGAINLMSIGPSDHAYTIVLTGSDGRYDAVKPALIEIDFGHTTTFTVRNDAIDDLDFLFDAGPNNRKCRVTFTPNEPGKCETPKLPVSKRGGTVTFTATAKDMSDWDYSWIKVKPLDAAWPRFRSDVKIARTGETPKAVDPDLELERGFRLLTQILLVTAALVSALVAWLTRRKN
jgi:hypothetical protein